MKELFKTQKAFDYFKSITIGLYDYDGLPMLNSHGKYADYTVLLTDDDINKDKYLFTYGNRKIEHAFYLSLLDKFCCNDAIMIHSFVFRKSSLVVFNSKDFGVCRVLLSRRKL